MNMLNVKLLARILDTLSKPMTASDKPLVNRVVEFVGRERRYRYYSEQGFKSSIAEDHKEYIEKAKSFPVLVLPPRSGNKKKSQQTPTPSDTQAASATAESSMPQNTIPIDASRTIPESVTVAGGTETSLSGTVTDSIPEVGTAREPESVPSTPSTFANQGPLIPHTPESAPAGAPERFISVSLLKRRKILLSLLERKRMIELHQSLVSEYQQEKNRLFPNQDENSVIDRKTLYRTISILESEGLLKIYKVENIPLVGDGKATKTFCLHPSIDPTSEEVKAFVRDCSNRHLLFGGLGLKPPRKVEKIELEVESLDEMQQRLGQDFNKGPIVPLSDLGAIAPRQRHESKQKQSRGPDFEGLDTATEFGWNRAKMMRALVFHRFLLDKLGSGDKTLFGYAKNPNVLSTTPLFEVMHLRVFLIVVGIMQAPSAEAREFLLVHRDSSVPLNNLPEYMRPHVAPNQNFKKRLREVLEILDALGLITPLACAPSYGQAEPLEYATNHLVLNTHYEVHVNVRAPLDPRAPDKLDHNLADRKEYMLLAPKECRDFWMDLQASSSVMGFVPTVRSIARPWSEIRRDFLLNLCNRRIWAEPIRITSSQSKKLMTQVNTKIRFVPPAHDTRVDDMVKETGLPRDHVVQFYKAINRVWHANPMPQTSVRLPRVRRARQTVVDKQELSIAPITRAPSSSSASPHQGLIDNQGPSITSIQDRGGRFSVGQPKKTRGRRLVWADAEDERLLLSYAVTRCISDTYSYKFSWTCVAGALHGTRTREVCRHRFAKLAREIPLSKRVDSYRAQLSQMLPEICDRFGIHRKLDNFDINPLLAYFKPDADAPQNTAVFSSPLPADPKELEQYNQVMQAERFTCLYTEERLHAELSLPRRLYVINQLPPTLRTSCNQELDHMPEDMSSPRVVSSEVPEDLLELGGKYEPSSFTVRNEALCIEHTIHAIVKAIYSLPRQKRPRSVIRAILSSFQSSKVLEACEMAKEWKILTGIKNASYRIPGQRVGRSERFSTLMNGAYPRRLTAAATEIDEIYDKATERKFQLDAGPAEMMVFLTDIAMGWLELSLVKHIGEGKGTGTGTGTALEESYGQGAILDFGVSMKNTRALAETKTVPASTRIQSFKRYEDEDENEDQHLIKKVGSSPSAAVILDEDIDVWQKARDDTHTDFTTLLGGLTGGQQRLYKSIYIMVVCSTSSGMLLQDIKNSLRDSGLVCEDKDIMDCVRRLSSGKPPILVKVGMAQARFVIFGWHHQWTVNYHDAHETGELNPIHWVVPRMWKTLAGAIDRAIFETCLHSILTHIAEKPGISKGTLLKHFYKMFLAVELDDLIEELEERGAIEARYGILPQRAALFSKRAEYVHCDRDTIDERKVTNYFAQPAYYTFLDMSLVVSDNNGADAGGQGGQGEGETNNKEGDGEEAEDGEEGLEAWLSEQPQAKKARIE
ncbi:hypothetical protein BGX21_004092 [Mortierella sp. AD011]|nr:hypothetical protein BGX20_004026 [Mortierella sp. AD010]KAF9374608.1 hypothetical protein BGX21_004092 [Mortierella sp. AD011]